MRTASVKPRTKHSPSPQLICDPRAALADVRAAPQWHAETYALSDALLDKLPDAAGGSTEARLRASLQAFIERLPPPRAKVA